MEKEKIINDPLLQLLSFNALIGILNLQNFASSQTKSILKAWSAVHPDYKVGYDCISNQDIEYTMVEWLKANGIEVGKNHPIQIRCLLKSETTCRKDAIRAGEKTNLPFIVVIFRQLMEGDYEKNALEARVLNLVRKAMGNSPQDRSQITLHNDDDLNSVLKRINYGHDIKWHIQMRKRIGYAYIDPGAVLALRFGLPAKEIDNYTFDASIIKQYHHTKRKFVMKILYGPKTPE